MTGHVPEPRRPLGDFEDAVAAVSDATRFATRPAQRAAELGELYVGQAVAEIVAGHLAEAVELLIVGMWKEWGVDRHSDANPLLVWWEFCDRLERYGNVA